MGIGNYSTTPGSNTTISGTNIAEGCAPSGINDAIRQMMADIAAGTIAQNAPATTGSAGAYVVTLAPVPAAWTNLIFACIANFTSVGNDTVNPNGLGAKNIFKKTSSGIAAIAAGDIHANDLLLFAYDGTQAQLLSAIPAGVTIGGSSGQLQYNNAGALGGVPTVNGDGTLNTSTGALAVTKTSGVSFAASATTDTTNAANISSGTIPLARVASGTPTGSKFVRDDQTLVLPPDSFSSANYAHFREQQTSGVATTDSSMLQSAYVKRTLNTTITNNIGSATLTTSVISLPAGTYHVRAATPGSTSKHRARLRNTTDSTTLINGPAIVSSVGAPSVSELEGTFTLGGTKNIELQQYNVNTGGTSVGGDAMTTGEVEVYSEVYIWKVA